MTKSKKSSEKRNRIYETAISLISTQGFEKTTMRQVAKELGVAVSGIYYHFPAKEHIIYEFYQQNNADHVKALGDYFQNETSFRKRLHHYLKSRIDSAEAYKEVSKSLFKHAAHPDSPLSPFSEQSKELRVETLEFLEEMISGSDDSFPQEIREDLPEYVWMMLMGTILYWLFDRSENSQKTHSLINQVVPLVDGLNQFLQSPMAKPFKPMITTIMQQFRPQLGRTKKEK